MPSIGFVEQPEVVIIELIVGKYWQAQTYQPSLIWILVTDIGDRVRLLDVERDRLARQRLRLGRESTETRITVANEQHAWATLFNINTKLKICKK